MDTAADATGTPVVEPIRVLHLFAQMEPAGAEMRLIEILGRLSPHEFQVDVCALSGLSGSLDDEIRAHGGNVIPVPLDLRFPWRFMMLLRRGRYRVVHSHVLYTSGLLLAMAAAARVPVRVAHFRAMHDGRRSTAKRRAQRALMRLLIDRYATDIVACGEGSMNAVWRRGWRDDPRCQIIYNAVDPGRLAAPNGVSSIRTELGIPGDARIYLHLGNETMEKNHGRLIAIFAAILMLEPSSRLVLAGAGTNDPAGVTASAVRVHGIRSSVCALGVRHDVARLLAGADALLLPSIAEGLPGVVLEACAAGVPVLASDLPGVQEVAARLALVRTLALTAADEAWASTAVALPAEAERMRLRQMAAEAFRASVFHVDRAAAAHRALWREARPVATPSLNRRRLPPG